MRTESPCHGCESRHLGYHGECRKYAEFKETVQIAKHFDAGKSDLNAYKIKTHRRIANRAAPSQRKWVK